MSELPFEKVFERLEAILDKMNNQKVSLDESIKLFKEADELINRANTRLVSAEQKIESLIKNRSGQLDLRADNKPQTKPLEEMDSHILDRDTKPF